MLGKLSKSLVMLIVVIFLGLWLISGVYTLNSDGGEKAVIMRFGKFIDIVEVAGLHWHLPSPIEKVEIVRVEEVRRLEFGFKTSSVGDTKSASQYTEVPNQSLMLTGDENMVNAETVVQYKIGNIKSYIFSVDDPDETLQISAESAIRRVIANHDLDEVLTVNKSSIQDEIRKDLQEICNNYNIGIDITQVNLQAVYPPNEVDEAFKDVANAREDKNSFINEAESYSNEIIPKARGNAAAMINDANAYKEKRIAEAKGDVANFEQILEKYQLGKEVTRTRMYLETLEEILPGIDKYIVDGDGNTIKFLPLDQNSVVSDKK